MQKGFASLVFILIISVLSVGIVGGAWFYKNKYLEKLQPEDKSDIIASIPNTSIPVTSLENIADWKVYKDEIFSLQYPPDWELKENKDEVFREVYNPKTIISVGSNGYVTAIEMLPFSVEPDLRTTDGASPVDIIGLHLSFIDFTKAKKVDLSGRLIDALFYDDGWNVIFSDGKNLVIFGPLVDDLSDGSQIENKILSTLKFTKIYKGPLETKYRGRSTSFHIPRGYTGSITNNKIGSAIEEEGHFKNESENIEVFYQVTSSPLPLKSDSSAKRILIDNESGLRRVILAGVGADIYQPQIEVNYHNKGYVIYVSTVWNEVQNKKADVVLDEIIRTFSF
ncbi:hypothetical protein HYT74_04015 [Candidatus Daviesbacteria bacterium]|nr:hypothetical protein [Candidatus Daviesbacteria bacterium]MBI4038822.1 hypothetical protein [Candidatus Daviesbacteria bacterium]